MKTTTPLPKQFMVSTCAGNLYDTSKPNWTANPVRTNYSKHHRVIKTVADLKACLRAGPSSWPGGYALGLMTTDGGLLCFDCARKHFRSLVWSIKNKCNDGWRVEGLITMQDSDSEEVCSHCSKLI